jgi:hypothetical protein
MGQAKCKLPCIWGVIVAKATQFKRWELYFEGLFVAGVNRSPVFIRAQVFVFDDDGRRCYMYWNKKKSEIKVL